MTVFNIHEAKTSLSKLVALAEAGEEIVIARHNIPVVRIVPLEPPVGKGQEPKKITGFGELAQTEMTYMEQVFSYGGNVPPALAQKPRQPGALKGMFTLPATFFDPLPEEELQAWEGAFSFDPDRKP
jgi:prevent-host-death family protein